MLNVCASDTANAGPATTAASAAAIPAGTGTANAAKRLRAASSGFSAAPAVGAQVPQNQMPDGFDEDSIPF